MQVVPGIGAVNRAPPRSLWQSSLGAERVLPGPMGGTAAAKVTANPRVWDRLADELQDTSPEEAEQARLRRAKANDTWEGVAGDPPERRLLSESGPAAFEGVLDALAASTLELGVDMPREATSAYDNGGCRHASQGVFSRLGRLCCATKGILSGSPARSDPPSRPPWVCLSGAMQKPFLLLVWTH